jgi:hypothetical protein
MVWTLTFNFQQAHNIATPPPPISMWADQLWHAQPPVCTMPTLTQGYRGLCVHLTIYLHLLSRLRTRTFIPPCLYIAQCLINHIFTISPYLPAGYTWYLKRVLRFKKIYDSRTHTWSVAARYRDIPTTDWICTICVTYSSVMTSRDRTLNFTNFGCLWRKHSSKKILFAKKN